MKNTKELGNFGENIAMRYLQARGYTIIAQNYSKPWGEIDIIARHGEVVVFVEVKTNDKEYAGGFKPEVRVNHDKLAKITKTAMLYLEYELKSLDHEWRVDIIAVTLNRGQQKASIRQFKNITSALM